ncbi:MAG: efflux RND transporter periplasmic adaptor subunit [Gammaproteobacteria bacterium]
MKKLISTAAALVLVAGGLYAWQHYNSRGGPPLPEAGGGPAPVGVVVAPARLEQLPRVVEALGTTRALEAVEITSRVLSVITDIRFAGGQEVSAGDVLVELENAEERASLAEAEAAVIDSRSQFERARALAETQVVSESQLLQLEATLKADEARLRAAQARLEQTVIRAPFAGYTGLRTISPGTLVTPGTVVTTLDDLSSVRLDFSVPEAFLDFVSEELQVSAKSVAFPDRSFDGRVTTVDTRVDPVTRAVTVRAELPNTDRLLKPGMFLTVRLEGAPRDTLVIPEAALVPEADRQFVFVVRDETARRVEVAIGRRLPGEVEVLRGLAPGDRVVVEGTQKVVDGTPVFETAPIASAASS